MFGLTGDTLVSFVTFLLVLTTTASIVAAWLISRRQDTLQKEIAENGKRRDEQHGALIQKIANETAAREIEASKLGAHLAMQQRLAEQRMQLIPLWESISTLSEIDPSAPVTPDVIQAVNALEFVAICCEAGVVDKQIVMRTFREKYLHFYKNIDRCGDLPGFDNPRKNGRDLLSENISAQQLFTELEAERVASGRLNPV